MSRTKKITRKEVKTILSSVVLVIGIYFLSFGIQNRIESYFSNNVVALFGVGLIMIAITAYLFKVN